MAIRGAATACIGRQRHPSLLSIPHCLHLSFHPSSRPLHGQLLSPPISQRGGYKYPIRAVQGATADSVATRKKDENEVPQDWKIKMLYDGDCPLCMHEVNMLRQRNKGYGTIKFVNISSDDYSPEENQALDFKT
ncbi:uncharacterized protein At5g50100, mitochondrial-like, partial [Carica papaya]|uniref:uncharacterized protein At5g50100, mitochondrial-like n=1 Tax=Carica papaya TaxID=3649 RepID=UPI000B8D15E6